MSTSSRTIELLLIMWAVSFTANPSPGFAGEKVSVEVFKKQTQQLEDHWKAGNHGTYFVEAARWAKQLRQVARENDSKELAAAMLRNHLERDFNISEIARNILSEETPNTDNEGISPQDADLTAMYDLASYLASQNDVSEEERRSHATLLARCLGKIRKEKIPDFKEKPVSLNVCPPPETPGIAMAGMDPDVITDPVAKAKYKAAIQTNEENNLWNWRQVQLRSLEEDIGVIVRPYLVETFRGVKGAPPLLEECMKSAKLSDKERKEVLAEIHAQSEGAKEK